MDRGMKHVLNTIDQDISLVLDNLPVGILRLDADHNCIYANKFLMEALDSQTCVGLVDKFIQHIHQDERQKEVELANQFFHYHSESESFFQLYNKSLGEYRWMNNKRILLENSGAYSFMYMLQDVHTNKSLELELRKQTMKLEQAYRHKSRFLANMSHEIRTPLNGIIGMLTLLEDTELSSDQQDYINMVKECSFNLMAIINDILDFSKLEVGKITLDAKPMYINECIESTNDIILSKVYEKSLEYAYSIDPNVPGVVLGDSNRIKQVLLNLLSNAIKFTEKGTLFLNVELLSEEDYELLLSLHGSVAQRSKDIAAPADILRFRFDVTDTGCGISGEDMMKLFKSFNQLDHSVTTKVYQGTGLGLAISKELVELMNGFIWLDWSEIDKGSRFSFVVSLHASDQDKRAFAEEPLALNDMNVLIVDDNLQNRISLAGMVRKWGMKPYSFSNSEEALYFTKITKFDIGLIDICMPKCDGPTFATRLRQQTEFENKTFPLIALSSLGDKVSKKPDLFVVHLTKPIKESRLRQTCLFHLQNHHQFRESAPAPSLEEDPKVPVSLDDYLGRNDLGEIREKVRILLAEDVFINQRVVVSFLNKLGFSNIQLVENGEQCLELLEANDYDIVLLDIRMPVMNGEEVFQKLKEMYADGAQRKSMPYMVAVTAYCLNEDKPKYLGMGFDDYIPKPIALFDLKRCMHQFLQKLLND